MAARFAGAAGPRFVHGQRNVSTFHAGPGPLPASRPPVASDRQGSVARPLSSVFRTARYSQASAFAVASTIELRRRGNLAGQAASNGLLAIE